jgi:hypothetical protein
MKYRVQELKDGYGKSLFRPQYQWLLFFWRDVHKQWYGASVVEFATRKEAHDWITDVELADEHRRRLSQRMKARP